MKRMSKTKEEYLDNGGWSSHYFLEHARHAFTFFESLGYHFSIGRHVIYLHDSSNSVLLKFYVHYKGRSRKQLTVTNNDGIALFTASNMITPEQLCEKVLREIVG